MIKKIMLVIIILASIQISFALKDDNIGLCHTDCIAPCMGRVHECPWESPREEENIGFMEYCCNCGNDGPRPRIAGDEWNECLSNTNAEIKFKCVIPNSRYDDVMPEMREVVNYNSPNCECQAGEKQCIEEGGSRYKACSNSKWQEEECSGEQICSEGECVNGCVPNTWCKDKGNQITLSTTCKKTETPCPNGCIDGSCVQRYRWPTNSQEITAWPNDKRDGVPHNAIDIADSKGSEVDAITTGVIEEIVRCTEPCDKVKSKGYGNYIVLRHYDGLRSLYAHLNTIDVTRGASVSAGQKIGEVGEKGWSTGPHLHLELRQPKINRNGNILPLTNDNFLHPCEGLDCGIAYSGSGGRGGNIPDQEDVYVIEKCKAACTGPDGGLPGRNDLCEGLGKYNAYFEEGLNVVRSELGYEAEKAALIAVGTAETTKLTHYDKYGQVIGDSTGSTSYGVMQVNTAGAARNCKQDLWPTETVQNIARDPRKNIICGTYYISMFLRRCGGDAAAGWGGYRAGNGCRANLGQEIFKRGMYRGWQKCLSDINNANIVLSGIRAEFISYRNTAGGIKKQITDLITKDTTLVDEGRTDWQMKLESFQHVSDVIDQHISYLDTGPDVNDAIDKTLEARGNILSVISDKV